MEQYKIKLLGFIRDVFDGTTDGTVEFLKPKMETGLEIGYPDSMVQNHGAELLFFADFGSCPLKTK